ncbi:MAG: Spy/CpxP family protein refolding chaperone [Burkholderiaceae bacterium]|nr:Spy/CpxP family protein refolding chaperone [Burkholderiaceae bacterium]MDO9090014.1 Spy/CpxP family protein refolding chaperone [Burkholderiaceae bacterium]
MKTTRTHWLLAAVLATTGFAAMAQTPAPAAAGSGRPAMHERMGRADPARMQERIAKRHAELRQKLKITATQEPAWAAFTAAMQPQAWGMRTQRAEMDKLSTPERIDRMQALRATRAAQMDKRLAATKTFYAALTPEQQKTFDAEASRRGGGHKGHGGHGHGHGGHGHRG